MREVKTMKLFKKTGAMLLCIIMAVTMILPLGVRAAEEGGGDPVKVLSQIRLSVGDGQETPVYKAGEKAELKINVINKGNVDAQDVTIIPVIKNAAEPQTPQGGQQDNSGGGVDTGDSGGTAGDLGGGMVYNSEPMTSGGGSGSAGDGSVPRVIVTGFDTEPGDVRAGTNFKLVVHLKNTSKRTAVSNMLFDFQAPSAGTDAAAEAPAFLPVSGSSTVYMEKIAAGGTQDISIDLNARADLVQKPYSISLSMKYEDSSAVQYEGQSSLAIPVKQEARFEFSEIQVSPDTVMAGEEANITCSLYNLGRVKMYNVKVRFEGDAIEGQELFLGNLDSGSTGTIDGIVTAVAESYEESNCRLILSYEDDAGNVSSVEQKFTMMVNPEEDFTDTGMMEMTEEDSSSPLPGILLAVAAVIVIGMILAAVLIRKKKRDKAAAEEEELMDEVERLTEDEHQQP